ncbi:MAG TPA: hypothetical protein PLE24_09950 [Chitinispirillaceae bacterium]|nr:hypothetical protein [Chitinispirillaceae bacterium]
MEDGSPTEAGAGKLKMLLLALKYSRSPEILSVLPQIIRISEKVQSDGYLYVVLTYLQSVIDDELKGRFREIVVKEHKDGEAIMKTIADSYREEGRKEKERELKKVIEQKDTALKQRDAEIEHKEEFVNQIVKRMTQKGMSLQSIQDITGLDNETIEKIIKKT